jgi:hypothetical protein
MRKEKAKRTKEPRRQTEIYGERRRSYGNMVLNVRVVDLDKVIDVVSIRSLQEQLE